MDNNKRRVNDLTYQCNKKVITKNYLISDDNQSKNLTRP
jgi:membrane-bound inhibitor of C-type lysozyme